MNRVINDIYEQVAGGEENLSQVERWTSMLGGVVLAAAGLRRGGVQGAVMGVAGGLLAARGLSGHCAVKAIMNERSGGYQGRTEDYLEPERRTSNDRLDRPWNRVDEEFGPVFSGQRSAVVHPWPRLRRLPHLTYSLSDKQCAGPSHGAGAFCFLNRYYHTMATRIPLYFKDFRY